VNRSSVRKTDYSKIAEYYDKVRLIRTNGLLSRIVEYGRIDRNRAVLDIGCGTGRFTLNMLDAKPSMLFALEPSAEMLKQAVLKDRCKHIFWIRGDGQRLPLRDKFLDCVYMTSVIHHIENKNMALQDIRRVLKKNGNCVIMTYSHSGIKKHVINDFPGVTAIDSKRMPSIPCLKNMMRAVGFKDVKHHVVKVDEGYVSVSEYLERVRSKYVSTLTLLDENAFQRGLKTFEERIRKKYGGRIRKISWFVIVVGRK